MATCDSNERDRLIASGEACDVCFPNTCSCNPGECNCDVYQQSRDPEDCGCNDENQPSEPSLPTRILRTVRSSVDNFVLRVFGQRVYDKLVRLRARPIAWYAAGFADACIVIALIWWLL